LSNGRDAASGASLRLDSACIWAKPAIGSGAIAASVPPAITTSARPSVIRSCANASASDPDAQALTGARTAAFAPNARPTEAAGPFGISIGTTCGDTFRGPASRRTSCWWSRVSTPPMPEPTETASRSWSTSGAPASAHASRAATSAICWVRSSLRASTRPSGGSVASVAAMWTGSRSAQSAVR
jgi:hypothetical protein